MFFNRYFWPSFLLIIVIASLHITALSQEYYWTIWWYDVMMHFLGGTWTALFILWIAHIIPRPGVLRLANPLSLVFLVIMVGIVWELYELLFELTTVSDPGYVLDTVKDFCMDTLGAVLVAVSWARQKISS
jgi:hypothetical protein